MKCAVLIGDGMADYPRGDLDGKTPLEAAITPNMDWIAAHGRGGLARTIPDAMPPGSDVANMEIMGYDTTERFTGRAVFEALSMGHYLGGDDVAFRANLVTLENGIMRDYSAGHISTQESEELMLLLDEKLGTDAIRFYPGVSYRNLMVWAGGTDAMTATPPHDIIGREYGRWLPKGDGADVIIDLMQRSADVLAEALVNRKRIASGKLPATSVWLWGQGRSLSIQTIEEKFGLKGGVISAVDLVKGIGVAAGLTPVFVPGATGYVDTNYLGKAETALATLETKDFVYVHVEAPDEASHAGDLEMKIKAIEDFDRDIVGTVLSCVRKRDDYAVLVTPDHRTPLLKRTHTREPVPFAYYGPGIEPDDIREFSERGAERGEHTTIMGHDLMNIFIGEFIPL